MLEIIKEEIIDGYKIIEYSNGAVVKQSVNAVIGEPEPPQPTEQEILQAELLLNQMTILENQTSQDAVMAEILLGQLGV